MLLNIISAILIILAGIGAYYLTPAVYFIIGKFYGENK